MLRPVHFYLSTLLSVSFLSCVSTGKYKAMEQQAQKNDSLYTWSQRTLKTCQEANNDLTKQKTTLKEQVSSLDLELNASKENVTSLRKQLLTMSALNSSQAESIRKSLDNIGAKDLYIQELQAAIRHRDSVNRIVMMNMRAVLGNVPPEHLSVKMEKGVLVMDLSDSLLFNGDSTGYTLNAKAKQVLGRLARVLDNQPEIQFVVEGHTDSVAYARGELSDNWDLSAKRAGVIVRALQTQFNIAPGRMTVAGAGEWAPAGPNDTPEGMIANRRTRIIIQPQLEQLYRVLDRR